MQRPQLFDVVVGSNLFGDILSDLGPAVCGTIGIAPSANINPERDYPSLFEPVHGSAPDIAGKGMANPIGQIWCGAMMLEHLGHADAAAAVMRGIERVLAEGPRTPDLGGKATTTELGRAVADAIGVSPLWQHSGKPAEQSAGEESVTMIIGIPRETRAGETRVAATPETVKKLAASGKHAIVVEAGRGQLASSSPTPSFRRRARASAAPRRPSPRTSCSRFAALPPSRTAPAQARRAC